MEKESGEPCKAEGAAARAGMASAFAAGLGQAQLSPFPLQSSALQPLGTFLPLVLILGYQLLLGLLPQLCHDPCARGLQWDGGDIPGVMPESGLPSRPGMLLGQEMF